MATLTLQATPPRQEDGVLKLGNDSPTYHCVVLPSPPPNSIPLLENEKWTSSGDDSAHCRRGAGRLRRGTLHSLSLRLVSRFQTTSFVFADSAVACRVLHHGTWQEWAPLSMVAEYNQYNYGAETYRIPNFKRKRHFLCVVER